MEATTTTVESFTTTPAFPLPIKFPQKDSRQRESRQDFNSRSKSTPAKPSKSTKSPSPTKLRRDRILKDRARIRPMETGNEAGYGKDMGILWAAYVAGGLDFPEGLSQEEFVDALLHHLSIFDSLFIAEDKSTAYESGRGPVAIWGVKTDAALIKPEVMFFKWASKRNILRVMVSFFQMVRYSKDVGVCVFIATKASRNMYMKMRDYGLPMFDIGNGYFSIAGRKLWHG